MNLVMSAKERDRLVMMRRLNEGEITMRQAAGARGAPAQSGGSHSETVPLPFLSSADISILLYPRTFSFCVDAQKDGGEPWAGE
jgi:hypothetical protein